MPRAPPRSLPRAFFARGAKEVARGLVGATLWRESDAGWLGARLVETEAYIGEHDGASHARFGRTRRTEPMYGEPGHAYVYLVYGLHSMLNVVAAPAGDPQAVLLRGAVVVCDPRHLPASPGLEPELLAGPGLLARRFGVTRADDTADLLGGRWRITAPGPVRVRATARIGVDFAGSWSRRRLRFVDPAWAAGLARPRRAREPNPS